MTRSCKNRKAILYIMGIDWEWIYQRPQIFAGMLAKDFDVTVVFPRSILKRGRKVVMPDTPALGWRVLWTFPYQEKTEAAGLPARFFQKSLFKDIDRFDYVYVGYPLYARYIPEDYRGKIIYDCMDNHEALYPDPKRVWKITEQEQKLITRCDSLIVSSDYLCKRVKKIYGGKKPVLIRNGVFTDRVESIKQPRSRQIYELGYIGTVSEWFDYEVLRDSMLRVSGLRYHLIGPYTEDAGIQGIIYEGVKEHDRLWETVLDYDCLIMPFKVNDIVAGVDPVKLYEYIAFGKCIVSIFYEEIARFADFVYFYSSADEYAELLKELKQRGFPAKYSREQREYFLAENSWDARYEQLCGILRTDNGGDRNGS